MSRQRQCRRKKAVLTLFLMIIPSVIDCFYWWVSESVSCYLTHEAKTRLLYSSCVVWRQPENEWLHRNQSHSVLCFHPHLSWMAVLGTRISKRRKTVAPVEYYYYYLRVSHDTMVLDSLGSTLMEDFFLSKNLHQKMNEYGNNWEWMNFNRIGMNATSINDSTKIRCHINSQNQQFDKSFPLCKASPNY